MYSLWKDATQNAANVEWVRKTWKGVQPFVPGGVYANELGEDDGDDRIRQAYGRQLRPPVGDQGAIRPGQSVPLERQHPAGAGGRRELSRDPTI